MKAPLRNSFPLCWFDGLYFGLIPVLVLALKNAVFPELSDVQEIVFYILALGAFLMTYMYERLRRHYAHTKQIDGFGQGV